MPHEAIKKTAIFFVSGILLLLGIYLCLLFIINFPPVQKRLINIAEKQGSRALNGSLSMQSYFTNLLSRITIYNIKIRTSSEPQNPISVDKLQINFSFWPLLKQKLVISKIEATGGTLAAVRDKSGRFSIPGIPTPSGKAPEKGKKGWQVEIGNVCAREIDLKYHDMRLGAVMTIKKIQGCVRQDDSGEWEVRK